MQNYLRWLILAGTKPGFLYLPRMFESGNEPEIIPPPFSDRVFDWVGRVCFPRQQEWERRRNAKIMVATVTLGLLIGLATAKIIRQLYYAHH